MEIKISGGVRGRAGRKIGRGGGILGVFVLCVCAGVMVGSYIKNRVGTADAASANITVVDNNQVVTADQGTPTITRTSTVTIKDTTATYGYTLSARITTNSIPNSTIKIGSASSTTCTLASPCTITTNSTPTTILETTNTNATTASGDTTIWTVTITLPSNTPLGNYILDIAYSEDPITPPPAMQEFVQADCDILEGTPSRTTQLRDERDDKVYRVRKMADDRCWMIDNLAYDINSAPADGKPAFATTPEYDSTPSGTPNLTSVNTKPQYAMNTSAYNIPNNGNPTPSYLYNWCAAMGDTSANCATTVGYTAGQPNTPQTGICPAGWYLPMGGAEATTSGNGTNQATAAATTTNEFAKLDIWMMDMGTWTGGTGTNRLNANTYSNFTTDDATFPQFYWLGVLGGLYGSWLYGQGSGGRWWSSTAGSGTLAYYLSVGSGSTSVSPAGSDGKNYGFAVRCIF